MQNNEKNNKKDNSQGSTVSPPDFSATQTSEGNISPLLSVFRGKWMALIVLLVSLVITFFSWYLARGAVLESAKDRFVFRSQTIESELRERLHDCAFLLETGAALFAGSEEVTRTEWQTYVTALQIDQHYPGIQGLGFSKRIPAAEKKAHIRQIRAEGFPNYDIHPDGERLEYTSIIFLEPFDWRNQRAFGYDMFSEPTRKDAMEMARDTGSAALSGKVTLLQETEKDVQAGFLMYLPVYRNGEVVETPEQRRKALTGYVYNPLRMNDLMQGILREKKGYVELQVFDGDEQLKEALLYPSGNQQSLISHSGHVHFATYQSILEYGGHRWLLDFTSSPYFEETIDTAQLNSILLLGSIISILLFAVVVSLTKSRNLAFSLANMSVVLEKANLELRREIEERKLAEQTTIDEKNFSNTLIASQPDIFYVLDQTGRFIRWNDKLRDLLGLSDTQMAATNALDIIHEADRPLVAEKTRETFEQGTAINAARLTTKTGIRDFSLHATRVDTAEGTYAVGVGTDITERKQAEQLLSDSENRYRNLIETTLDWVWEVDENAVYTYVSPRAFAIIGYQPEELIGKTPFDLMTPEEAERVANLFGPLAESQQPIVNLENTCLHKDGHPVVLETSGNPVTDTDGKFCGYRGIDRDITERKQAEREVQKLQEQLSEQVLHDPLTGLYNRRYLDETMRRELIRSARNKQAIGIVMCDLDHFKDINDTYGHLVGDEVLRVFADLLRKSSRASDIVCRYGGEEFLLLLPDMPPDLTYQRAEQLRSSLAAMRISSGEAVVQMTASFGVATFPANGKTQEALIRAADAAMYHAKETGRNRVVVSSARSGDDQGLAGMSNTIVSK